MKILSRKVNKIIRSNKGETLVESLVSMLIMTILLLGITAIIQTSLRMTDSAFKYAQNTQESVNDIMAGNYSGEKIEITFSSPGIAGVTHKVIFTDQGGIMAFVPDTEVDEP